MPVSDPLARLRAASCSDGAPSARNLLVTVFGDVVLPHSAELAVSVRSLADALGSFGVNERLVRTSLTRLVNDGLLTVRSTGRRSFYGAAPKALELFRRADDRIYGPLHPFWDGSWTIVVVDASEATAEHRALLREELSWTGLGVVAPNVMASPVVAAADAAAAVDRVGGFENVLVSRSEIVEGASTIGVDELARRCVSLDDVAERYHEFVRDFAPMATIAKDLYPEMAFKLRVLVVASYRRIVLTDPVLPHELLPDDWVGDQARRVAGYLYDAVAEAAEAFWASTAEPARGSLSPSPARLRNRFVQAS